MAIEKDIYLPHVLKLLWDAEELKDIFNIKVFQRGSPKLGILACTDKRAIIILENQPDHRIDFKRTLRIYSIRLSSIIDLENTGSSIRISSKNHGLELFFDYGEETTEKVGLAESMLTKRNVETRQLSDIWRKFMRKKD